MELAEWDDSLSVGNVLMDAHHQAFFRTLKEFSEYPHKSDREAIGRRIEFLLEYAQMHFGAEERLMLKAGYPGLEGHKATHDDFARELLSLKASFDKDPDSVTADAIIKIMQKWLVHHISGSDKDYMPYVQNMQE